MKKIVLSTITLVLVLFFSGCNQEVSTPKVETKKVQTQEDIRIISTNNSQGKITAKSIEEAFKANGFVIVGNNDMNKAFEKRFGGGKDFQTYRLMFVHNPKQSVKLLKEYPEFGLLAPLGTSVYSKDGSRINISALSLDGMSRISGVPKTNTDLIALFNQMTKALEAALPNGKFQKLNYKTIRPEGEIVTKFAFVLKNEGDIEEAKESYQETMEGEIESQGFIVAGFYPLNEDIIKYGNNDYELYIQYIKHIQKLEHLHHVLCICIRKRVRNLLVWDILRFTTG